MAKWFLGNPEDRAVAFESSRPWKPSSPICMSVLLSCLSKEKGVGCRPELDLTGIVFCTLNYSQMYFNSDEVFSLTLVRSLIIWPGYYLRRPLYSNLWFIHSWQHVSLERFLFCVWNSFLKIQLCSLNEKLKDGRDCYGDKMLYKLFILILQNVKIAKKLECLQASSRSRYWVTPQDARHPCTLWTSIVM